MEAYIYIILFIFALLWVNGNIFTFFESWSGGGGVQPQKYEVIEYLTMFCTKPKNYRRTPEGFQSYGFLIDGTIGQGNVSLVYNFPFVHNQEVKYTTTLFQREVSEKVGAFGVHQSCFARRDDALYELRSNDFDYLNSEMNKDGFYFNSFSDFGLDYNHTIQNGHDLGLEIAGFIVDQLQNNSQDSYFNRIQASLNFVQFIPYGQPTYDEAEYGYFGLSLPWESISISYADCDSKSVLFACILKQMISNRNIVLVICEFIDTPGAHMIIGVSNIKSDGQKVLYGGKEFLLLETTIPRAIMEHRPNTYVIHKIIPIQ